MKNYIQFKIKRLSKRQSKILKWVRTIEPSKSFLRTTKIGVGGVSQKRPLLVILILFCIILPNVAERLLTDARDGDRIVC